jgi:hypothetical protein
MDKFKLYEDELEDDGGSLQGSSSGPGETSQISGAVPEICNGLLSKSLKAFRYASSSEVVEQEGSSRFHSNGWDIQAGI